MTIVILIFTIFNAEHEELPVIKISSDEGREGCQQLKPKGTQASLGTTLIAVTILLILSILLSRVTVIIYLFSVISQFCVKRLSVLMSVR